MASNWVITSILMLAPMQDQVLAATGRVPPGCLNMPPGCNQLLRALVCQAAGYSAHALQQVTLHSQVVAFVLPAASATNLQK